MDWIEFASHDICRAKYENDTLYISFGRGGIYTYDSVPYTIFLGLVSAEDKRAFFNANIRQQYHYQQQSFN